MSESHSFAFFRPSDPDRTTSWEGLKFQKSNVLQAAGLAVVATGPRVIVARGLPIGLLTGAALFGFGFALVFPLLQEVAVTAARPDRTGSATATVLLGMDLGIGLGAIAAGTLAAIVGIDTVYLAAALFSLGGVAVTVFLRSRLVLDPSG